jgi:hypothetical protein
MQCLDHPCIDESFFPEVRHDEIDGTTSINRLSFGMEDCYITSSSSSS